MLVQVAPVEQSAEVGRRIGRLVARRARRPPTTTSGSAWPPTSSPTTAPRRPAPEPGRHRAADAGTSRLDRRGADGARVQRGRARRLGLGGGGGGRGGAAGARVRGRVAGPGPDRRRPRRGPARRRPGGRPARRRRRGRAHVAGEHQHPGRAPPRPGPSRPPGPPRARPSPCSCPSSTRRARTSTRDTASRASVPWPTPPRSPGRRRAPSRSGARSGPWSRTRRGRTRTSPRACARDPTTPRPSSGRSSAPSSGSSTRSSGARPRPFDRARLELAHAEWLRRHGRPGPARRVLHRAHATFAALGTEPLAARTAGALAALGDDERRGDDLWRRLSPQEAQIARLVAEGLSNREIGQQLFLSHRTVGSHLYRIFPKLDITSRVELARLVLGLGGPPPDARRAVRNVSTRRCISADGPMSSSRMTAR